MWRRVRGQRADALISALPKKNRVDCLWQTIRMKTATGPKIIPAGYSK